MSLYGVHPLMSPLAPCKSKSQHRYSLLLFIACSSDCNSGLEWASVWCAVYWFFHGWRHLRKRCWSLYIEYDLLHTRVHLLWLWEFWIGISAWWLRWNKQLKFEEISGQSVVLAAALCRGRMAIINVRAWTRNRSGSLRSISLYCKGWLRRASWLFVVYKRDNVVVFIAFVLYLYLRTLSVTVLDGTVVEYLVTLHQKL